MIRRAKRYIDPFLRLRHWRSWTIQTTIFLVAGGGAFLLRFDLRFPENYLHHLRYALFVWVLVKTVLFRGMNLDRCWWRFVGVHDLLQLLVGNCVGSAVCLFLIALCGPPGMPRSIYFLDGMLCFLLTAGVQILGRSMEIAPPARRDGAR